MRRVRGKADASDGELWPTSRKGVPGRKGCSRKQARRAPRTSLRTLFGPLPPANHDLAGSGQPEALQPRVSAAVGEGGGARRLPARQSGAEAPASPCPSMGSTAPDAKSRAGSLDSAAAFADTAGPVNRRPAPAPALRERHVGCSATIWMGRQRQSGWPFWRSRRGDDCRGATITQALFCRGMV